MTSFDGEESRVTRAHYGANAQKVTQLCAAGLVATIAMLVLGLLSTLAGLRGEDFAALWASVWSGDPRPTAHDGTWWLGLASHFLSATILFPLAYDFLIDKRAIPNRPWLKGILFGGIVWLLLEMVLKPLAGAGVFSTRMILPAANLVMNLFICGFYGFILEAMTRVPIVHELRQGHHWKRAA